LGTADAGLRPDPGRYSAGSNAPPAEVFGVIETALRAQYAKPIE
jgi:hypothetical protein